MEFPTRAELRKLNVVELRQKLCEASLSNEGIKEEMRLLEYYEQEEAAREDKASEEDTISSLFSDEAGEPEVAELASHKDMTTAVLAKMIELQMSKIRKRDREAAERQTALMELIGRTSETKEERETKMKEEKKLIKGNKNNMNWRKGTGGEPLCVNRCRSRRI